MKRSSLATFVIALFLPGASWSGGLSVRALGDLPLPAPVIGRDAAYSIDLGDGSLWLFGDTFFRARPADGRGAAIGAVSNSAAVSRSRSPLANDGAVRQLNDRLGRPKPVLEYAPSEDAKRTRLWPGDGVKLGGRVYLYYTRVAVHGEGGWDFRHIGHGLAVSDSSDGPFRRLANGKTLDFWGEDEPRFGVAVLRGGGVVYVYGREERAPYGFKLARVPEGKIAEIGAYEYFAGEGAGWTRSVGAARDLFVAGPPEASVSFNRYLKLYLMVYSRLAEGDVVMRVAKTPWGPWSSARPIYRCPSGSGCYAAKEHAEYASADGKTIYFTMVDRGELGGRPRFYQATFESPIR